VKGGEANKKKKTKKELPTVEHRHLSINKSRAFGVRGRSREALEGEEKTRKKKKGDLSIIKSIWKFIGERKTYYFPKDLT